MYILTKELQRKNSKPKEVERSADISYLRMIGKHSINDKYIVLIKNEAGKVVERIK
jgi:hypothetical protein